MVPLHILTGFLGAGKTTVLAELLRRPGGERIAVLVNEVGELSLDHHLLERVDDGVYALPSGCVCCAIRGELPAAIERALAQRPQRIVLETTGLADPAPILHTLASDPRLSRALALAGVTAVVDAPRLERLLDDEPEVRRQLELADRIVLTKADLAPERAAAAHELLAEHAPGRSVREAVHGAVDADWLLQPTTLDGVGDAAAARVWLHHGGDAPAFASHVVQLDAPTSVARIELWLRLVTQLDGDRLLRAKLLVECADTGAIFAVQSAGHAVHPARRLAQRPAGVRGVQAGLSERGRRPTVLQRAIAGLRDAATGRRLVPGAARRRESDG